MLHPIAGLPTKTASPCSWNSSTTTVGSFPPPGSTRARPCWPTSTCSPARCAASAYRWRFTSTTTPFSSLTSPEAFTQLGAALHFYEISLRFAPTPQAKGKIERAHGYWQKRLPSLFSAEHVSTLPQANTWIDSLLDHRNRREIHREICSTPQAAWNLAKKEGRSALRPAPKCPWWSYVFSQRSQTRVGSDGRIAIGSQRLRLEQPPATLVTRCLHPDGSCSVLLHPPRKNTRPVLLLRLENLA